jgi:hypothetical protein
MKLVWDAVGEKKYETGVKKGVLYPQVAGAYSKGVAWNGLTAITEKPTGAEVTKLYANDAVYGSLQAAEDFEATIEAYTYPVEFEACDGSKELVPGVYITQQERQPFGLSYVTTVANDSEGLAHGYKLHIVYGCVAKPSEKAHSTINENPEATTMSWDMATTPVPVEGFKPTSHLVIDSTKFSAEQMKALEDKLYGTEQDEPSLPMPADIAQLMKTA